MSVFIFLILISCIIMTLAILIPVAIIKFANITTGNKVIDFFSKNTSIYLIGIIILIALVSCGICKYFTVKCTSVSNTSMMVLADDNVSFPSDSKKIKVKVLNENNTYTEKVITNPIFVADSDSFIEKIETKQTLGFLYNNKITYIVHLNYERDY